MQTAIRVAQIVATALASVGLSGCRSAAEQPTTGHESQSTDPDPDWGGTHNHSDNHSIVDSATASVTDYRRWKLVNPEPYDVSAWVSTYCRMVPNSTFRDNPHAYRESGSIQFDGSPIRVWVNESAEAPMFEQAKPNFPIGSIIVKEKLIAQRGWNEGGQVEFRNVQDMPELLTVMIKREADFNPDAGDWEFLVYSGDAKHIQGRGRLESCQHCHIPQAETDFVFRDYLPESDRIHLGVPSWQSR